MISVILFVYLIQDIEEAGFFDIFTRLFYYYSSFNLFIFHFFIYPFIYIYIYIYRWPCFATGLPVFSAMWKKCHSNAALSMHLRTKKQKSWFDIIKKNKKKIMNINISKSIWDLQNLWDNSIKI
jgi:hypothetical protein